MLETACELEGFFFGDGAGRLSRGMQVKGPFGTKPGRPGGDMVEKMEEFSKYFYVVSMWVYVNVPRLLCFQQCCVERCSGVRCN